MYDTPPRHVPPWGVTPVARMVLGIWPGSLAATARRYACRPPRAQGIEVTERQNPVLCLEDNGYKATVGAVGLVLVAHS